MIKNSQGNAKKVKTPYKIRISCISVSKLGYKTPFYIRPVQNPRRTDQNMDLICQSLRYPPNTVGTFALLLPLMPDLLIEQFPVDLGSSKLV